MADEIRSIAALKAELADNTIGAISPQDVRDMLASLSVKGPSIVEETPFSQTTLPSEWVKLEGTTTFIDPGNGQFEAPISNTLINDSPNDVTFQATITANCIVDDITLGDEVRFGLYKNASLVEEATDSETGRGGSNTISLAIAITLDWAPTDVFELFVWTEVAETLQVHRYILSVAVTVT